ncbi:MAG: hypothetical protein KC501_29095 [Myxococcales bacterium]|nr:hypothetical protein [Myxococcales bacterium]
MSDRISEAINALRTAAEISSAHDALEALSKLVEGLTLEQPQVNELQGELAEVDHKVEELQLALNVAKADLDKYKEEHGFFDRAFGPERREWSKLRKEIQARAAELAQGQALKISLTLMLDQAASAEGRPTGLKAAEWRTRIEEATAQGAGALAAVLLALREESKSDAQLVGRMQEALDVHGKLMKKAKLRKLVRMMSKTLGGAANDIDLQEALYNDALVTLRTLVEAELASGEQFFLDQTKAAEWLADVTPRLDVIVDALGKAQEASDAVEVAIPAEEQAKRQVEQSEERLAELEDDLDELLHPSPNPRPRPPRPRPPFPLGPGVLLPRAHTMASPAFTGRVGAPIGAAGLRMPVAAPSVASRVMAHSINTPTASSGSASAPAPAATPAAAVAPVAAVASSPVIINLRPGLEGIAGLRPIPRPVPTPIPVPTPTPTPRPDPTAEKKARLEAEIATVKEQLVGRRGALARASADLERKRHGLGRAIAALDRAIAEFHAYLKSWPSPVTMPEPIVPGLPKLDLGSDVGLAGPDGGLLPATVHVAEVGGVQHMVALEELFTSVLAEARATGELVAKELGILTSKTEDAVQARMAALLHGETTPIG